MLNGRTLGDILSVRRADHHLGAAFGCYAGHLRSILHALGAIVHAWEDMRVQVVHVASSCPLDTGFDGLVGTWGGVPHRNQPERTHL